MVQNTDITFTSQQIPIQGMCCVDSILKTGLGNYMPANEVNSSQVVGLGENSVLDPGQTFPTDKRWFLWCTQVVSCVIKKGEKGGRGAKGK